MADNFIEDSSSRGARPNFLGIGAPKCGTTWLSEVLRKHPDVFMAHGKELEYFASDEKFAKGEAWYLGHFSGVEGQTAVGEITVSYMVMAEAAAERIRQFDPDIKLIAVLRDPVYRAYSNYRWLLQMGIKTGGSFLDILREDQYMFSGSLYYQKLLPYWERFPDSNLLLLKYEDIGRDAIALQRSVFRFLGVSEEYDSGLSEKVIGKTIAPRSRGLERLRIKTHKFVRENNLSFLITLFKRSGLSQLYRQVNDRGEKSITQEEYVQAAANFRDDVANLAARTGIDFSDWLVWKGGDGKG